MLRMLRGGTSILLLLALGFARVAEAQTYPDRPITLIIPFAPAGGTDSAARILTPILSNKLGATVVIENLGGAAGNIGATRVARATPDGYTLLMHNVAFAINATMYRSLPFDVLRDFVPIAFVNYSPLVIVGRTSLVPRNMHELVGWMRKRYPGVSF